MAKLKLESTSDRVLRYIMANPGCHLRRIKNGLHMSMGSVQYQLEVLERRGKIYSARRGLYKFYIPSGVFRHAEHQLLHALSMQTTREMLIFIIDQGNPTQTEIANHLQISAASVNWHARRLIELKLIHTTRDKKYMRYSVDNDLRFYVASLLKNYYPSVWEKWSSRLGEMFLNLSGRDTAAKDK
jgi:predicted transcriptional regulator